jgi:hypothetical protein
MDSPRTNLHSERFVSKYYSKDSQFGRAFDKNPLVLAVLKAIPGGCGSSLTPKLVDFHFSSFSSRFRAQFSPKMFSPVSHFPLVEILERPNLYEPSNA